MTAEELSKLVDQSIDLAQKGKTKLCREILRTIYAELKKDTLIMWHEPSISKLGKAIIIMLHLDLIDNEEKDIGLVHLAYLYISKGIENEERLKEEANIDELLRMRKDRIILTHGFDDYFVDSLQEFYYANEKTQDRDIYNDQRKTVLSKMPYIQFADIHLLEEHFPNLADDVFLLEVANYIELEEILSEEDINEALMLHQILFKFTLNRLIKKQIEF